MDMNPLCEMLQKDHGLTDTQRDKLETAFDARIDQAHDQWVKGGHPDEPIEVISYVELTPKKYFWIEMMYDPEEVRVDLLEHGVISKKECDERMKELS